MLRSAISQILLFSCLMLAACAEKDLALQISQDDWQTKTLYEMLDEQKPNPVVLRAYTAKFGQTKDPVQATYIGLLQIFGPAIVHAPENGWQLLYNACEQENARACRTLGRYMTREPAKEDREYGLNLLEYACDENNLLACADLADIYGNPETRLVPASLRQQKPMLAAAYAGQVCAKTKHKICTDALYHARFADLDQTRSQFKEMCDAGETLACRYLGQSYYQATNKNDHAAALAYLRPLCDAGDQEACFHIIETLRESITTFPVKDTFFDRMDAMCFSGDRRLCVALSNYYLLRDKARTQRNWAVEETACKLGDIWSCILGADGYKNGHDREVDKAKAAEFYKIACEHGDKDQRFRSCRNAALLTSNKATSLKDATVLERACYMGDEDSCRNAAWELLLPEDLTVDDAKRGAILLKKGCEQGFAMACKDYGTIHEYPQFRLKTNLETARRYYNKACKMGYKSGCDREVKDRSNET